MTSGNTATQKTSRSENNRLSSAAISASLAGRFAVYTDGVNEWPLGPEQNTGNRKTRIRVLSRYSYTEQTESFPLKSASELKKLLNNKYPGYLHFIGDWQQNSRQVLLIKLKPQAAHLAETSGLLIPETLLLAEVLEQGLAELNTPAGVVFAASSGAGQGLGKSAGQSIQTAVKGGVINSAEAAKLSLGVATNADHTTYSTEELFRLYSQSVVSVVLAHRSELFKRSEKATSKLPWASMGIAAAALLVIYAGLSTLYLSASDSSRQATLDGYGEQVTERLNRRSQMEQEVNRLSALNASGQSRQQLINTWEVIAMLRDTGVTMQNVTGNFRELEFRAVAPSATTVVERAAQHELVQNIEFTSPVRSSRQGETFSVRIELREQLPVQAESQQGASNGE